MHKKACQQRELYGYKLKRKGTRNTYGRKLLQTSSVQSHCNVCTGIT